jgi:hypothetical protein
VNPAQRRTFSVYVRVPNHDTSALYASQPAVGGLNALKVNGKSVEPAIRNGYAVITRAWRKGDKIDVDIPMQVQRIKADGRVAADHGRMALRYGPLIYNIEKVDEDINKVMDPNAPLTAEWRGDLLGGVMVIKGKFTDGTELLAIPNYARDNRDKTSAADRNGPRSSTPLSTVWIRDE